MTCFLWQVILYRSGLVTAASSFVLAASAAFLPDDSLLSSTIKQNLDYLYVAGSCGLGLSLLLIHIYVSEIKRTLQALWVLGILGSFATYITIAQPANENLIHCVLDNPSTVWLVGPLFAALTGLVFKEGTASSIFCTCLWIFMFIGQLVWLIIIIKDTKERIEDIKAALLTISPKIIFFSLNRSVLRQGGSWTSDICYTYSSPWASGILFLHFKVWGIDLINWLCCLSDLTNEVVCLDNQIDSLI